MCVQLLNICDFFDLSMKGFCDIFSEKHTEHIELFLALEIVIALP